MARLPTFIATFLSRTQVGISACILFSALYQDSVMKRDRLNRVFYRYVIKDENTKNDYLKLDSLMNIREY